MEKFVFLTVASIYGVVKMYIKNKKTLNCDSLNKNKTIILNLALSSVQIYVLKM